MSIEFPLFVGMWSVAMALTLAFIEKESRLLEGVNLPYGFNIPVFVAFVGTGYYTFATKGLEGLFDEISKIIFFSVFALIVFDRYLRGKDKEL